MRALINCPQKCCNIARLERNLVRGLSCSVNPSLFHGSNSSYGLSTFVAVTCFNNSLRFMK